MLNASPAKPFTFDEATHIYRLGDRVLPSITQILKECGYVDDTYYTEEHRYRGQYVHWCVRLINENNLDWDDVHPEFRGYCDAYVKAVKELNIVPISFEEPLYHSVLHFAGTPDIVAEDALWELKTGAIMKWAGLQTAGQEILAQVKWPRPKPRRRFGLRLNKDGTYEKPKEFRDNILDKMTFMALNTTVQHRLLYGSKLMGAIHGT